MHFSGRFFPTMDPVHRYKTYKELFIRRKMQHFPLLDSAEYARVYGFFRILEMLKNIDGDIVEFGVGRGISLAYLVYGNSFFDLQRTIYAFDSFAGFPKGAAEDVGARVKSVDHMPSGWTDTSIELIRSIFEIDKQAANSLLQNHEPNLKLIQGFFEQTVKRENLPEKIAFLHIDCDMYEGVKLALESCLPFMQPNSIIQFDEYHAQENWPGEKKAADEVAKLWGLEITYSEISRRYIIYLPNDFNGQKLSAKTSD